jgi:hypothetical protein
MDDKSMYIVNFSSDQKFSIDVVTKSGTRVNVPVGPKSFAHVTTTDVTGTYVVTGLPWVITGHVDTPLPGFPIVNKLPAIVDLIHRTVLTHVTYPKA